MAPTMNRPRIFWVAWGLCALALAIILGQWVSVLFAGRLLTPDVVEGWSISLVPLMSAVLAALILVRHPRHAIGWVLMVQGVGMALAGPVTDYMNGLASPPAHPSALFLVLLWFSGWSWVLLIFPLFLIPLLFPTGRPLSPRWNWVLALGLGMGLSFVAFTGLLTQFRNEPETWTVPNPIGLIPEAVASNLGWFWRLWSLGLAALTLLSLASLILRYRRGSPVEREQIKWLLFGCGLFAAGFVPSLWTQGLQTTSPFSAFWTLLFVVGLVAIPASIGIAILRYRLWDIDVLIRRTLIYSVLTGLLALAYFGLVVALQNLLRTVTAERQNQLVTVVSTLAIAALFVPLRRWVQAFIDRRFYRRKYDAAHTLAVFGAALRDEVELDSLTQHLVQVVQTTMEPASVSLWLKPAGSAPTASPRESG
jgi:hypothetical protein